MKTEVLQYQTVAIWVFSKANSDEFMKYLLELCLLIYLRKNEYSRFYMWEILHSIVKRTIKNIKRCSKELEEAKEKLSKVECREVYRLFRKLISSISYLDWWWQQRRHWKAGWVDFLWDYWKARRKAGYCSGWAKEFVFGHFSEIHHGPYRAHSSSRNSGQEFS